MTKPRQVCILGYAEETRDLVHNLSEDVEIWGINMAHAFTHRTDSAGSITPRTKAKATSWFQMHPRDWANPQGEVTGYFGRPKEHLDFLQHFQGDVWMQAKDVDVPNGKRYPLEEITKASGRTYFTSTFAYQAGMLWYQHKNGQPVKRLYVYGVNLSSVDEYIHQKPCVEYWIGRLEEAGVEVIIPNGSSLLKGKVYAMDRGGSLEDHAFERLQHYKAKYMESWANVNTMASMIVDTQFWANALSQLAEHEDFKHLFTDELKAAIQSGIDQRVNALTTMRDRSSAELNGVLGMVKDNQHWLAMTGGIDHRAPSLPELRLPSNALAQNWEVPEQKSI